LILKIRILRSICCNNLIFICVQTFWLFAVNSDGDTRFISKTAIKIFFSASSRAHHVHYAVYTCEKKYGWRINKLFHCNSSVACLRKFAYQMYKKKNSKYDDGNAYYLFAFILFEVWLNYIGTSSLDGNNTIRSLSIVRHFYGIQMYNYHNFYTRLLIRGGWQAGFVSCVPRNRVVNSY
jgi:hypothetical protein